MDNENELQKQIDELKLRLDNLNAFQKIPLQVDTAWKNRGFIKQQQFEFFVFGTGSLNVAGQYKILIPGANLNSMPFVTPFVAGGASPMAAEIILESGNYLLYVEGTATERFYYVVFLFKDRWYRDD
jgi:hypothetical protein